MAVVIDVAIAVMTVVLGAVGLVAPRYAAGVLDLVPGDTTMGLSELRASAGGLFVALGCTALLTGSGAVYLGLGIAYAGAAVGRAVSLGLDGPPMPKAAIYFAIEAAFAAWLVATHLRNL
ncbi:DUF4345 family protein [Roseivivax sediminis]|uniref:DUF4345 domain-containing protein n=1 Tax=Roseivivax sediminis TaxID=936889 RepID=A0A1I1SJ61_9RHOB|nr:DUF4345 family protein [Roseivivax sediminis]SFD44688.1 protein of unknown function [Roseivivax sediminis]